MQRCRGWVCWSALVVGATAAPALALPVPAAAATTVRHTVPESRSGIAGWREAGSYGERTVVAGEGAATVSRPRRGRYELYRGTLSVPANLAAEGWTHIGDPDSVRGYVFDAYQGSSTRGAKMFLVTTPSGSTLQYVHTLVPGELYNNSFVAISPDAQWMVAGECETISHLQIYPTPVLNRRTAADGGTLRLAGYIQLDHQVNDIQGCDFVTPIRLICASDDSTRSLFANEKPLLEIELPKALTGHDVGGHVVDLGSIPQQSRCSGTFEAEGVDFDRSSGVLRVEMIQPGACALTTTIYEYKAAASGS